MYKLITPKEFLGNSLLLQSLKMDVGKDPGLLKAVLDATERCFDLKDDPSIDLSRVLKPGDNLVRETIRRCEIDLVQKTTDFVKGHFADMQAAKKITNIFHPGNSYREKADDTLDNIGRAVEEQTKEKIEKFFHNILRGNKLLDWVKLCLSGLLLRPKNPFVPGLVLSLTFSREAENAPEGEQKTYISLQTTVDKFLLEVLERLPQTVRGCEGRMNCDDLFEPKKVSPSPLQMMVGKRKHRLIFCKMPLVMDYLSDKFRRGLPGLPDTDGILDDWKQLKNLAKHDFILDTKETLRRLDKRKDDASLIRSTTLLSEFGHPLVLLQGSDADFPGLAGIPIVGRCPGLQFITAGIAGKPSQYYSVPMLRMVLEFVVYVAMLAAFSFVLFHSDGELTRGEVIFFVSFVAAGIFREAWEIMDDLDAYLQDDWNILDVLGLAILLAAFVFRVTDNASPWGLALYALSAPLVFSRVLFFAQILPFQGPMIQVIFSMTEELIKFGVVMLIVMVGFVVAFFALFMDDDTFGQTCLSLFKAMLGEVGLFDEFGEHIQGRMATALFTMYLVIINIMLLNLLIAVLSTSHSKVEENADREYKVSKARMIQHYEKMVDNDILPAPFCLIQLILTGLVMVLHACYQRVFVPSQLGLSFTLKEKGTKPFGQAVFWLVLGPVAVVVGILLWILSIFYAPYAWTKHYASYAWYSFPSQWILIVLWCGLGAPLYLMAMWLWAPLWPALMWLNDVRLRRRDSKPDYQGQSHYLNVNEMLLNTSGVDAQHLFEYLVNPMSDPLVRQDEINKCSTVEHIKLLRNRLQNILKEQNDELRELIEGNIYDVKEETKQREEKLEQKLDEVMQAIKERK